MTPTVEQLQRCAEILNRTMSIYHNVPDAANKQHSQYVFGASPYKDEGEYLKSVLGGAVYAHSTQPAYCSWRIQRRVECETVAKIVAPYLNEVRRAQIETELAKWPPEERINERAEHGLAKLSDGTVVKFSRKRVCNFAVT